jgi:sterol desaturase/sphingolipid hydroxylase (fatty acid hydroxylase superfamily)
MIIVLLQHFLVIGPIVYFTQDVVTFKWSRDLPTLYASHTHLPFPTQVMFPDFLCLIFSIRRMLLGWVFVYLVLEDFTEYWMHRLFHTPFLYKHIHKQHHFFQMPFSLCAEYAHPLDFVFCNYIPVMMGPCLFPQHVVIFWAWLALRILLATELHTGYSFPWNLENFFYYYAGPKHHDRHHEAFMGNYGSTFKIWDIMFGTMSTQRREKEIITDPSEEKIKRS